ncbi:MAG: hypothetical protein OEO19_12700 [Gammaproteobacteria bacterium]|nr:hypothetical protein [Gammaproteobacteria bacterium]MDH3447288.1 hypothetical protein [Gammaproteobacteria bacterium]
MRKPPAAARQTCQHFVGSDGMRAIETCWLGCFVIGRPVHTFWVL